MSFPCARCKRVQPNHVKPIKVITKVRAVMKKDFSGYLGEIRYDIAEEQDFCPLCAAIPLIPIVVNPRSPVSATIESSSTVQGRPQESGGGRLFTPIRKPWMHRP